MRVCLVLLSLMPASRRNERICPVRSCLKACRSLQGLRQHWTRRHSNLGSLPHYLERETYFLADKDDSSLFAGLQEADEATFWADPVEQVQNSSSTAAQHLLDNVAMGLEERKYRFYETNAQTNRAKVRPSSLTRA